MRQGLKERNVFAVFAGADGIEFNRRWTGTRHREELIGVLARDWLLGYKSADGFMHVAFHELGHSLHHRAPDDRQLETAIMRVVARHAFASDTTPALATRDLISDYATRNMRELVAEAFAGVAVHGDHASPLSRAIVDLVRAAGPEPDGG